MLQQPRFEHCPSTTGQCAGYSPPFCTYSLKALDESNHASPRKVCFESHSPREPLFPWFTIGSGSWWRHVNFNPAVDTFVGIRKHNSGHFQ